MSFANLTLERHCRVPNVYHDDEKHENAQKRKIFLLGWEGVANLIKTFFFIRIQGQIHPKFFLFLGKGR